MPTAKQLSDNITKCDCALFDIDGVLVDIRKSYNIAIKKTVAFMLKQIAGSAGLAEAVTGGTILKFRQTGGFNNDTDTSYCIALAILALLQKGRKQSVAKAKKFLSQVAANADASGIASVEKYLSSFADVDKFKSIMSYPAPVQDSIIARVFDELFYGPELFRHQDGLEPKYYTGKPLIKNDKIVVSKKTMKVLSDRFNGNLAIVSGRSRVAAEYSLKPVFHYFNLDACVFLEDEKREYAKPNPYAIKKAMETMNTQNAVYFGDSAEDLMMARDAERELETKIFFMGIYGFSPEPAVSARKLKEQGADGIFKNIDLTVKYFSK